MVAPTRGIQYAASDNPGEGRGLQPMGGVPAITNPLPNPALEKNGEGPDLNGSNDINQGIQPDVLSADYQSQAPGPWPPS